MNSIEKIYEYYKYDDYEYQQHIYSTFSSSELLVIGRYIPLEDILEEEPTSFNKDIKEKVAMFLKEESTILAAFGFDKKPFTKQCKTLQQAIHEGKIVEDGEDGGFYKLIKLYIYYGQNDSIEVDFSTGTCTYRYDNIIRPDWNITKTTVLPALKCA